MEDFIEAPMVDIPYDLDIEVSKHLEFVLVLHRVLIRENGRIYHVGLQHSPSDMPHFTNMLAPHFSESFVLKCNPPIAF